MATHAPSWERHLPAGAVAKDVDLTAGGSLPQVWAQRWRASDSSAALLDATGATLRAEELESRSRGVAQRLAGHGVVAGDRVLVSAESSVDLAVLVVAALRLGAVVVPMNTAYRGAEVAHIVGDIRPVVAVVDDADRARFVLEADGSVVVTDPTVPGGGASTVELDRVAGEDPALICYTSGTTGHPKGAVLSHANLLATTSALALAWRWEPDDRLVCSLPLFHVHGLGVGVLGSLAADASVVILPTFDPDAVLDAAAATRASLFFGVPTMYHRWVEHPRRTELSSFRLCVSGSAPLAAALHERIADACGQAVLERYGMSETGMNVSNPYDGERRPGTVGFPLPGVEVRLVPLDESDVSSSVWGTTSDAAEVADAATEIELRGPNVFGGYWERPDANRSAFARDGWFRSGDLGALDDDGYLRIVGRARELIISGGFNVYPREVEDVLAAHPAVREAAVVGVPSDEWGETVTAFVVLGEPCLAQDLIAFAQQRLARFKCPRVVHVVDALPRNALGKVLKQDLRA